MSLLEPTLTWHHLFEPSLPSKSCADLLQSPYPFVCGLHRSFIDNNIDESLTYVSLDRGRVSVSKRESYILKSSEQLTKDIDAILRPCLHSADTSAEPLTSCASKSKAIRALISTYIFQLLGEVPRCCTKIDEEVLFDEKIYSKGDELKLNFSRSQMFNEYLTKTMF